MNDTRGVSRVDRYRIPLVREETSPIPSLRWLGQSYPRLELVAEGGKSGCIFPPLVVEIFSRLPNGVEKVEREGIASQKPDTRVRNRVVSLRCFVCGHGHEAMLFKLVGYVLRRVHDGRIGVDPEHQVIEFQQPPDQRYFSPRE